MWSVPFNTSWGINHRFPRNSEEPKKGQGTDPKRLTNREKVGLAGTLRGRWPLKDILETLGMAKSSYEYASHTLERGESGAHTQARASVVASFDGSQGRYGYRRIASETGLGEWTVRKIMKEEEGLKAKAAKRRKGSSPDNARAEGLFGRLKVEFFYGCDWTGVTMERFIELLDEYLVWYRDEKIKSDLGYRSPMQYRKDLGLAA